MSEFNIDREAAGSGPRASRQALRALLTSVVAGALGLGAMAAPAHADVGAGNAEKLRRMDIMLMVTGLRCRNTADNFMDDYGRFTSSHMAELNAANRELRNDFARQVGEKGADRALDRISVVMANEYGNGHPWLGCSELRQVAKSLALVQGEATLVEAASQLLDRRPQPLLALAGR